MTSGAGLTASGVAALVSARGARVTHVSDPVIARSAWRQSGVSRFFLVTLASGADVARLVSSSRVGGEVRFLFVDDSLTYEVSHPPTLASRLSSHAPSPSVMRRASTPTLVP